MKMTLAGVRSRVRTALKRKGIDTSNVKVEARWLGQWSPLKADPTSPLRFRAASVTITLQDGRQIKKAFAAESDGTWMLR